MSHTQPGGSSRYAEPRSFASDDARGCAASSVEVARSVWRQVERVPAGAALQAGERPREVVILSGWACEQRILDDGRRQIFSFLLPGDPVEIQSAAMRGARQVLAVTRLELASVESLVAADAPGEARIARGLEDARRERLERLFDGIMRIGRLTAKERLVHLLLELHDRLAAVSLVKDQTFRLPLTQELLADALGLSLVHINRTLQQLRREGCVQLRSGMVSLSDLGRLVAMSGYERRRLRPAEADAA